MTSLLLILALGAPVPLERKIDKHPVEICGTWVVKWGTIIRDWELCQDGTWHTDWGDYVFHGTWRRTSEGLEFTEYCFCKSGSFPKSPKVIYTIKKNEEWFAVKHDGIEIVFAFKKDR